MPNTWREALYDYIAEQAKPQEKFGHQPRLYALTQLIGGGEMYDDDIVYAAVYLHDLGVFSGHRPEEPELLARYDNTAYAVERTPAILAGMGFPAEKIVAVQACIATHQPGHAPETIEATILRDADILEQLGAIGVLRTVCKVGRDTRFPTFTQAAESLRRALESLPAMIRLPQTRVLAEPRVAAMRHFLQAVEVEAGELLL
jgi:uncharacterized protein